MSEGSIPFGAFRAFPVHAAEPLGPWVHERAARGVLLGVRYKLRC